MVNYIFYGLVTSVVSFGYSLVLYYLGYHGEKIEQATLPSLVTYVIIIGGLVLGIREARKEKLEDSDTYTYGNGFGAGALISLFYGLGSAVFGYIYNAFINPEMGDVLMKLQYEAMLEKGMPPEQVEMFQESARMWFEPQTMALSAFVTMTIIGILLTLIIAIFMRVRPKTDELPVE